MCPPIPHLVSSDNHHATGKYNVSETLTEPPQPSITSKDGTGEVYPYDSSPCINHSLLRDNDSDISDTETPNIEIFTPSPTTERCDSYFEYNIPPISPPVVQPETPPATAPNQLANSPEPVLRVQSPRQYRAINPTQFSPQNSNLNINQFSVQEPELSSFPHQHSRASAPLLPAILFSNRYHDAPLIKIIFLLKIKTFTVICFLSPTPR